MWEFWQMYQKPDGWHARWGGEMNNVSTNPGYFTHTGQTDNWGATATGLPLLGGLITEADLQRGYINHALAISLVETAPGTWSWPAQRSDGGYFSTGITNPIPEGTRFRLDPTLNIASLHLPWLDRLIAQAAQTYGIVVRDKGGAVSLYAQDPKSIGTNPWPAVLDNWYPNTYLSWLPWDHLQALQTQISCCWSPPANPTSHPGIVEEPDDAGRYAGDDGVRRHVRSHQRTGCDHGPLTDPAGSNHGHVRREPGALADPDVVDRIENRVLARRIQPGVVVRAGQQADVESEEHMLSDVDPS